MITGKNITKRFGDLTIFDGLDFIIKLVDCLEKCLIYGHIRRFAD